MTQISANVRDLDTLSRATVEAVSRAHSEPDWLRSARLGAWERFAALPLPTTRDDGWRRTDLAALDLERLAAPGNGRLEGDSAAAPMHIGDATAQAGLLVLRNGAVERGTLDTELAKRGVLLLSMTEAIAKHPDLVRAVLGPTDGRLYASKLTALAESLWSGGAFVYIPRGVVVERPFQIVHWSDAPGSALFRTAVLAEEASSGTVVDAYASPEDGPETLSSGIVDLVARPAARLTYIHLQEQGQRAWSFTNLVSHQERDSAVTCMLADLGGGLNRSELACSLVGQGAEADIFGLVFGERSQRFDLQSLQDHIGSDTRSDLVHKVALRDAASSNFTGLIRVGLQARRTSSNQESRNLLLSDGSRADTDPKLEILNSDVVRCGHGAAVGPVDEDLIFYLMTRGLTQAQAERLIVEGFFSPLVERVPIEAVRERLWASITRKLEG